MYVLTVKIKHFDFVASFHCRLVIFGAALCINEILVSRQILKNTCILDFDQQFQNKPKRGIGKPFGLNEKELKQTNPHYIGHTQLGESYQSDWNA